MKSLFELKEQIQQTEELSTIITTMKNVSIVNMTHYERKLQAVRQYQSTIEQGFQIFLQNGSDDILEKLKKKNQSAPTPVAAVIIGSEKGLCGEFNEKIYQYFREQNREREIFSILGIGYEISGKRWDRPLEVFDYPTSHQEILMLLNNLLSITQKWLLEKKIGKLIFFHHQLLSGLRYEPTSNIIFPLNLDWLKNLKEKPWPSRCLPLYHMDKETLFYELTQENLFISMYRFFIESLACENAGRLSSMQTAEERVQDQLFAFKQLYNLQRQNQISEELADIIASFEVLKD